MSNFFIAIPTINRADLLNETLRKYAFDFPNTPIIVLDNGSQNLYKAPNIEIIKATENQGVAKSWNLLLSKGFDELKLDNAIVLNDDIYLGLTEREITPFLKDNKEYGFFKGVDVHWSVFIMRKSTFKKVGLFDESFFPAYFEDNDYAYRMHLNDILVFSTQFLNPKIYRNSMTIQKDPNLNNRFAKNRTYFIEKWGGEPNKETFITPFNK